MARASIRHIGAHMTEKICRFVEIKNKTQDAADLARAVARKTPAKLQGPLRWKSSDMIPIHCRERSFFPAIGMPSPH